VGIVVVVHGDAHLLEIILASGPVGGFTDLLDRRQQQADQDGDNRDDDQQFNQGESRGAVCPFQKTWGWHCVLLFDSEEGKCRDRKLVSVHERTISLYRNDAPERPTLARRAAIPLRCVGLCLACPYDATCSLRSSI